MKEGNEWDHTADEDAVEGPIERVMNEWIMKAFKYLKIVKTPWPSEAEAEMILANGDVGMRVLWEHCNKILFKKECQMTGLPVLQFIFLKEKEIS